MILAPATDSRPRRLTKTTAGHVDHRDHHMRNEVGGLHKPRETNPAEILTSYLYPEETGVRLFSNNHAALPTYTRKVAGNGY